jgi:hypothetical protein
MRLVAASHGGPGRAALPGWGSGAADLEAEGEGEEDEAGEDA